MYHSHHIDRVESLMRFINWRVQYPSIGHYSFSYFSWDFYRAIPSSFSFLFCFCLLFPRFFLPDMLREGSNTKYKVSYRTKHITGWVLPQQLRALLRRGLSALLSLTLKWKAVWRCRRRVLLLKVWEDEKKRWVRKDCLGKLGGRRSMIENSIRNKHTHFLSL